MAILLQCVDRFGRPVVLTQECWHDKIAYDHAEMRGHHLCLQAVLSDPCEVRKDKQWSPQRLRECFYRTNAHPALPNLYIKVVVEYEGDAAVGTQIGRVVTAYPTPRMKTGEQTIWP